MKDIRTKTLVYFALICGFAVLSATTFNLYQLTVPPQESINYFYILSNNVVLNFALGLMIIMLSILLLKQVKK